MSRTDDEGPTQGTQDRVAPPTLGLAAVADLWLWGALVLIAPSYIGIGSGWEWAFEVVGFGMLIISFAGALTELAKLLSSEGLNYWGVSLVFLVPAFLLFLSIDQHRATGTLDGLARIGALVLAAIGGAMFFQGIPYFFWDRAAVATGPEAETQKPARVKSGWNGRAVANAIVALLSFATAVVTLVEKAFH